MSKIEVTKGSLEKSLLPFRGTRILACKKTKNIVIRTLIKSIKLFHCEIKVDNAGYCVICSYKDENDRTPIEYYRFVGSNVDITVETIDKVFSTNNQEDTLLSKYKLCVVLKGIDCKKQDGRPLGELYFLATDSSFATRIKTCLNHLALSCNVDGSCKFKNLFNSDNLSTNNNDKERGGETPSALRIFTIDPEINKQIIRACTRLSEITSTDAGIFNEEELRILDVKEALDLLKVPPSSDEIESEEMSKKSPYFGLALLNALDQLKYHPISSRSFRSFCNAAKSKLNPDLEQTDSDEFGNVVIDLLNSLKSNEAIMVLKEISRAVRHIVFELKGISLFHCVSALAPRLVDRYDENIHEKEFGWLLSCLCSVKQRDRIFLKVLATKNTGNGIQPPTSSLSPILPLTQASKDDLNRGVKRDLSALSDIPQPSFVAESPIKKPIQEQEEEEEEELNEPIQILNEVKTTNVVVEMEDFEDVQQEIDSLTRLCEYLRGRLRDEPDSSNAHLLKKELEVCQAELQALGPSIFVVTSRKEPSTKSSSSSVGTATANNQHEISDKEPNHPDFVERALALWVDARKESLTGTKEQIADSIIVLKTALNDVRSLAENVHEFSEVAKEEKSKKTAVALIGMLEENVALRLRLLGKEVLEEEEKEKGKNTTTPSSKDAHNKNNNNISHPGHILDVGEEEFEI